jgi:hypothetical protein
MLPIFVRLKNYNTHPVVFQKPCRPSFRPSAWILAKSIEFYIVHERTVKKIRRFPVTPQLRITAKKDSGQGGMTRPGFADFPVIDPKIPPLTLTLSHKGRGDRISPPLPRGEGTKGRVTFSCSFVSHWLMSIPAIPNAFGRSGILPRARYQPVTESLHFPVCSKKMFYNRIWLFWK